MVALDESIERLLHNSKVFLDRQCHTRGGEGSRVYVAIRFEEECASNYLIQRLTKAEAEKQYIFEKNKLKENFKDRITKRW
ncbi:unnamed protein product [Brassica rapa]|uniref:Uncharacterized protein n=1 Tax=Brassica campestris TaxID=3711 RepID=A0A8D9LX72_BRACM|nr:unnamed protein product [Brassica rapa]